MTVSDMLSRMSSYEVTMWQAFLAARKTKLDDEREKDRWRKKYGEG